MKKKPHAKVAKTAKETHIMASIRREAAQGRREDFEKFLAAVPHREPIETDRLPE